MVEYSKNLSALNLEYSLENGWEKFVFKNGFNDKILLKNSLNLNKNIAVFGLSGSKKSRGFAIPNGIELAQEELQRAINRNMSLVFTDPKRRTI